MRKIKPGQPIECVVTQYGFKWGPCEVTRVFTYRGAVFIDIKTKRGVWSLKATPGGYVKFGIVPKKNIPCLL